MDNVYRYTPLFFYEFSFLSFFDLVLMNMQKRKFAYQHIEYKKLCLGFNLVSGSVV